MYKNILCGQWHCKVHAVLGDMHRGSDDTTTARNFKSSSNISYDMEFTAAFNGTNGTDISVFFQKF